MIVDLNFKLISFFLNFAHGLVRKLQLVRQVVDVSLKCFDFSDVVLLFLLQLFNEECVPTCILLHVQAFLIQFVMLVCDLLYCFLMSFILDA